MKIYLPLYGHANQASLPLRFGVFLTEKHQCFCVLDDYEFDEVGTKSQRMDEIEKGRKHYIGSLSFPSPNKSETIGPFRCRVVLELPSNDNQVPKVITLMGDGSVKGDMTVTRHIEGMLKGNQINRDDLIEVFHPAYVSGKLKNSNDCEKIWRNEICGKAETFDIQDTSNRGIADSLSSEESNLREVLAVDDLEETDLHAPLTYKHIVIPNVENEYVMADAYIESVRREDDQIVISIINSKGQEQELRSFPLRGHLSHLASLHDYAYQYLEARQKQRAKFAICWSSRYRGMLAESVTAISLQLNRNGL